VKEGQKLWTKDELMLAISLYCKLSFGKMHSRNPEIIKLASLINRTAGSLAFKLVNFASLDPSLKARGIKGASNASKLDKEVWDEFFADFNNLPFQSEVLRANLENRNLDEENEVVTYSTMKGKTKEQLVKVRVNQSFFRKSILASYNDTCCITGINEPSLLIAGHIKPWSEDESNRLNLQNGIAINALHDKAFENGLITITPEYKIRISSYFKNPKLSTHFDGYFLKYDKQSIILPSKFLPEKTFLQYHNDVKFRP